MTRFARSILFPGGAPNVTDSAYARAGREMYALAVAANRAGDYVPIWGTCLGFQLLTALAAGRDLLEDLPAIDTMEAISFAPGTFIISIPFPFTAHSFAS